MDIDSDFGPTRGSEVFEHLNELYGKDHCCNIITFSNLQARAIIKDVCRSFEVPLAEVNAITKFVPNDIHNFSELLEIKELKDFLISIVIFIDIVKSYMVHLDIIHSTQQGFAYCHSPLQILCLWKMRHQQYMKWLD